jgi:hypothetical protein
MGGLMKKKRCLGSVNVSYQLYVNANLSFFFKFFLMVFECKMWRDGDARFWRIAQ